MLTVAQMQDDLQTQQQQQHHAASERRRGWRRMSAVAAPAAVRKIRTRTGLTATIVAIVASVLAYALQGLGLAGTTPANLVAYGVTFAGARPRRVVRRAQARA